MRNRLAPAALILAAIAITVVGAGVALAHSGLAASSPGPNTTVGGTVEEIRIFYGDIILEFDADLVLDDTGGAVTGTAEMVSDIEGVITLEQPLSIDGRYTVRHVITSFDDDVVEDDFSFTYEAGAPAARVVFVEEDEGGVSWIVWAVAGVGGLVIVVLAVRLLLAIRRRQRVVAAAGDDSAI